MDGLARGKADVGGADDAGVLLGFVVPVVFGAAEDKAALTGVGFDAHASVAGHLAQLGLRTDRAIVAGCGLLPGGADDLLTHDGAVLVDLDGLPLGAIAVEFEKTLGICHLDAALAGDHHGLQVLGAENRAEAAAAEDLVGGHADHGGDHKVFARGSDAGDDHVLAVLLAQEGTGVAGGLAPEIAAVADLHMAVADPEIGGDSRLALNDDGVKAGALHGGGEVAGGGMREGMDRVPGGRFAREAALAAAVGAGAVGRAGGEDELVFRVKGLHLGADLLPVDLGRETLGAQEALHIGLGGEGGALARGQVDPQHFADISVLFHYKSSPL